MKENIELIIKRSLAWKKIFIREFNLDMTPETSAWDEIIEASSLTPKELWCVLHIAFLESGPFTMDEVSCLYGIEAYDIFHCLIAEQEPFPTEATMWFDIDEMSDVIPEKIRRYWYKTPAVSCYIKWQPGIIGLYRCYIVDAELAAAFSGTDVLLSSVFENRATVACVKFVDQVPQDLLGFRQRWEAFKNEAQIHESDGVPSVS